MSKVKIESIINPQFEDLTTNKTPSKQKGNTVTNKACIILSIWSLIFSIISGGIMLAIVSSILVFVSKSWKNLKTSSAKWAVSLTAVAVVENIVMTIILAL